MSGKVYHSIYPDIHVPTDVSLHQFLCSRNPDDVPDDKIILEDLSSPKKSLTYGSLRRDAAIVAGGLFSEYGLRAGDAVAILAQNSVDYSLLAHSVMWLGGIIVGINWLASPYDIRHYIAIARPKLVVVDPQFRPRVKEALETNSRPGLRPQVVDLGGNSPESILRVTMRNSTPLPPFDLSRMDNRKYPVAVVFSSGTSGKPKGVQWSHYGAIAHLLTSRGANPETQNSQEREVFYAPFAHMFGLLGAVLVPAYIGNYVMAMKQFDYAEWIQTNSRIRATCMKMVPPTAVALAKDPVVQKLQLDSVNTIVCAGGTLQGEVVQQLQRLFKGVSIVQAYGMSEVAVAGLRPRRSVEKSGSVGRLFPSVKLRLVDEQLQDVAVGVSGEALIKAPTVFMEYRNDPKATALEFHDGWLRTGDMLKMDKDGFLWFQDRKKEMIKYKGNQVAPAELEDILASHPDVLEAAVCAVFDSSLQTDIPIGYVSLKPSIEEKNHRVVLERILQHTNGLVAPYKKIRGGLHHLPTIPKNPTGKVMRALLPARVEAARIAAERASKL